VVEDDRLARVPEGVRLRAAQVESGALVETARRHSPPAVGRGHVHAPQVHLVGSLDVTVAVETHRIDEARLKRTEDHRIRRATKLLTDCLR